MLTSQDPMPSSRNESFPNPSEAPCSRGIEYANDDKAVGGSAEDIDFEPRNGIEFESHEAAYSFYQEYAKSMGFTISIKNSRRSKRSKEFIDAKFACSRYGVTPDSESGVIRRPTVKKTDCKASMHVKRRSDGKWIIHEFIKDHNHELLPALMHHFRIHQNVKLAEKNNIDILHAVSERTKKMYVEMSRNYSGCQNSGSLADSLGFLDVKGSHLKLDEGDGRFILEHFKRIQKESSGFFYAIDLNEDQFLRNLFWVDGKARDDYPSFSDVVSLDTSYIGSNEKLPLVLFVGVNHHCQAMLLGCGLLADQSRATFTWLLRTWLRAMGGKSPTVILTEQDGEKKAAVAEILPQTRHCYYLWHILEKVSENFAHVINRHEKFFSEFHKCIFKSSTDEQFDMRWWKMLPRFELQNDTWVQLLYGERKQWVPLFVGGAMLAGMSTPQRSESINAFFDKYMHKKMTPRDFLKQYGSIIQSRLAEEAMVDFDMGHKQPALKSPSPWEKQLSTIYTHAIFSKFQVEVLGVVGCHPKRESEDGCAVTFRVDDCEKEEQFVVTWNESKSEVSCLCRLFEYRGFLCRHAMIVLQMCGFSSIPCQYILKRWTKDAKIGQLNMESRQRMDSRVGRYNDLCRKAISLSEEGSVSEQTYSIAFRALTETLKNCVKMNNSNNLIGEITGNVLSGCDIDLLDRGAEAKRAGKRKKSNIKRKVQEGPDAPNIKLVDGSNHAENLKVDTTTVSSYYNGQPNIQGLLNLMEPPHDAYLSMHGLEHLNLQHNDEIFSGTPNTGSCGCPTSDRFRS
ncbi:hypothetical protein MLD38_023961 [Melastoma candidum]|uniref:Uncharacterized protein n=1 Tax=Melastoma candidum TaxID=119954 RepID=A0ACB9NR65_9MYRT|nr:hypothetical protein MLD38_023961 [Melastoma candidum]